MSFANMSLEQIRARVAKTLAHGIQLNMSTDESCVCEVQYLL
jgi:hypothetical protein